jgi:hypothetical protein
VQISGYHSDNGVSRQKIHEGTHPRDKVSSSLVLEPSGRNGVAENTVKIVTWKLGH